MVSTLYQSRREQFVGNDGLPLAHGRLWVGEPNQDPKTRPLTVYADRLLTTPVAQPILLDQYGRTDMPVWIDQTYSYIVEDVYGKLQVEQPYIEVQDVQQIIDDAIDSLNMNPNLFVNGGMQVVEGGPIALTDTFQQGPVTLFWGRATGVTSGTFGAGKNTGFSASGFHALFSGVTLSSTNDVIEFQGRLDSRNASRLANGPATFACLVQHDKGTPVDARVIVSKADALDDFATTTTIATGILESVPSDTATRVSVVVDGMGDCENGVGVTLRLAVGNVTGLAVMVSEFQSQTGVVLTPFSMYEYLTAKAAIKEDRAVGDVVFHVGKAAKRGTLIAQGAIVNRADYPRLWKFAVENDLVVDEADWGSYKGAYSNGDGSTTFRVPDLITNAPFFRAFDPESPRVFGTYQTDEFRDHQHLSPVRQFGNIPANRYPYGSSGADRAYGGHPADDGEYEVALTSAEGGDETRPKNFALLPCIIY